MWRQRYKKYSNSALLRESSSVLPWAAGAGQRGKETPDTLDETLPSLEQIHLPRQCASECAGMGLSVEGAAKSLHLPRLHALQATSEGVSVEGDFD